MYRYLLSFNWYGFLIGSAMVTCIALSYLLLKRRGYNPEIVFDIAIICIPLAILGARFYYIIFDSNHTLSYWFTDLRFLGFDRDISGKLVFKGFQGLAIYGGLIFAVLGAIIVRALNKRKKNLKDQMTFIQMLDTFFIMIILGQAIGRWGNFANAEAYGNIITNPAFQKFPFAVNINGVFHQATFFYESFFNLIGFFVLLYLYYGKRKSYDGFNFSVYCIWYGLVRAVIEGMRTDSLMIGGVRVSQILSILLICYGLFNIIYHIYMAKTRDKKIFIFVDESKLNLDYYAYERTIMYINSLNKEEDKKEELEELKVD